MNKITVDPCNVCGSTDVNLVDGFYYCVECGTQDVNVRQAMVIEERALADGTFTFKQRKAVVTILQDKKEMPGEWHKWHAYNFILVGLADELIAAGAKPSFKMKVLWLWTEYIKKFQNKEELGLSNEGSWLNSADTEESLEGIGNKRKKQKQMKMTKDALVIKKTLLFSILYIALNLDGSDIQLSDLIRFVREGRLDLKNCTKYIPKEINVNLIPGWLDFYRSGIVCNNKCPITSIAFLNCINVPPRLPDLRKIVDKFIKELCLPEDFKNLVFALMQLAPCNYLEIDTGVMKGMVRFPAYECVVMSYVLIAFKMCFGLDDDYEVRLSDAVDAINDENCHLKSYKIGCFSESTDRLFSFTEWCDFIQLRKIILSKYYLHFGEVYLQDIDDYVYMEQIQTKTVSKQSLTDEIIMKMLDKLPLISEVEVIPKSEFKATTTPLSTYTDIIMQYFNDPDLRLLFSEDFTKYSLKYAVENLHLHDNDGVKNTLLGINDTNKTISSEINGLLKIKSLDVEKVYVRNCENKNWIKTNQPKPEHIKKVNESDVSDKDSDPGYDSNAETVSSDIEANSKDISDVILENQVESDSKLDLMLDADEHFNIFEDDFEDIKEENDEVELDFKQEVEEEISHDIPAPNALDNSVQNNEITTNDDYCNQDSNDDIDLFYNPNTFDREKAIKELVLATCKKYKIRIPKEYDTTEPKKRKQNFLKDKAGEGSAKRPRVTHTRRNKPSVVRDEINDLIAAYYMNLEHDVLCQISEHVKEAINKVNETEEPQNIDDMSTADDQAVVPSDISMHNDDANNEMQENIDIHSKTLDQSSIQCFDDQDLEKYESIGDPKFDEKEYDIKQLYVKVEDDNNSDDPFDIDDPALFEILDKKIEEITKNEGPIKMPLTRKGPKVAEDAEDSDDDMPLSVLREEKLMINKAKQNTVFTNLEPLVKNPSEIKDFKYWIREYATLKVMKTHSLNEKFHKELYENYPRSFYFVIKECATMIETTPYELYKAMVNLELRLLAC